MIKLIGFTTRHESYELDERSSKNHMAAITEDIGKVDEVVAEKNKKSTGGAAGTKVQHQYHTDRPRLYEVGGVAPLGAD